MAALGARVDEVSVPMHRQAGPIALGLFAEAVAAILQANGTGYEWNIGQPGVSGKKIYARAGKIAGCKADNRRTIRAGSTS